MQCSERARSCGAGNLGKSTKCSQRGQTCAAMSAAGGKGGKSGLEANQKSRAAAGSGKWRKSAAVRVSAHFRPRSAAAGAPWPLEARFSKSAAKPGSSASDLCSESGSGEAWVPSWAAFKTAGFSKIAKNGGKSPFFDLLLRHFSSKCKTEPGFG